MTTKLLLVDADVDLSQRLRVSLTQAGFQVTVAHDGIFGLREMYSFTPDLILLDVLLPGIDGWQVCAQFREMTHVPILIMTTLGSTQDIVRGLELGTDDYLVKPVHVEELVARLRALLRGVSRVEATSQNGQDRRPVLNFDSLEIDFVKHEVTLEGERVNLSPTEFRLLSVMARHHGRVLPHQFLLTEVWGPDHIVEKDMLRLYISYLRRKIDVPTQSSLIRNQWGVGYQFG